MTHPLARILDPDRAESLGGCRLALGALRVGRMQVLALLSALRTELGLLLLLSTLQAGDLVL